MRRDARRLGDRRRGRTAPAELAAHIEAALRFLHVSKPTRDIPAASFGPASFAEFGLDPPASVVMLGAAGRTIATVEFRHPQSGRHLAICPACRRRDGLPDGAACRRRMANRGRHGAAAAAEPAVASRGASLLLPVSMAQVWAVEIVFAGKLTRFERDGAGNWFRHTGQHSHAASANAHVADPAQARIIDAALEAFDETAIETRIAHGADEQKLAQFGLTLPHLIVLLYARDSSTPLARLELGGRADSFDRYARLAPNGDVVTVAEFEVTRLTELLKAVGAGS